jgi:mannose-1-phosphate guanylyltransferase/mannose-6-phosphate isomerase
MADIQRIIPVIMCGGAGTRMWPLSRDTMPKQFIPLFGERSTFQRAAATFLDRTIFERPIVITNIDYRFIVSEQLKAIGCEAEIVLEPSRRDSGPAVALATEMALARDPDAVAAVLAADHVVTGEAEFLATCRRAAGAARIGRIVTIGVPPTGPATGYGYIKPGREDGAARRVEKFVEKPDAVTAARYLTEGYLWNSGNFFFHAATMREELARFEPAMLESVRAALAGAGRDLNFLVLPAEAFNAATKKSIDFAVMERTDKAMVVNATFGWSDVGGWGAVWELSAHDAKGNAIIGKARVHGGANNYVRSEGPLTVLVGLDDVMVVSTPDAVLVSSRDRTDDLKKAVETMKAEGVKEASEHAEIHRPWGKYHSVDVGQRHQVKRITVRPGGVLSLQKHRHRAEHWVVVKGTAEVTRDDKVLTVHENESVYLPMGCLHRLANRGKIDLEIVEVQVGSYLGEDDIERFEDVYNRS